LSPSPITVDVHIGPDEWRRVLRADVASGLSAMPKTLPPKWFYDDYGSELFDKITRLPEYYPTRREAEIIEARAVEIVKRASADTFIELGSGTSTKTRMLLNAGREAGLLQRFIPFDVSEATLRDAASTIASAYHGLEVHAVVGDFERHLALLPKRGRRMVLFLGSTIGNLIPAARAEFFQELHATLEPGDVFLLGADLVKDPKRLVDAYDDAAGVTAAFNRNVLTVVNRELDGDFDTEAFDHVALWDSRNEWIEMRLRSQRSQSVRLSQLDLTISFAAGEEMHTEISAKFRQPGLTAELEAAGFEVAEWWTDTSGDFALSLSFA
jgi:L-histidine N-alpha-methyltransferase